MQAVLLTELLIKDMDLQLRERGIKAMLLIILQKLDIFRVWVEQKEEINV